MRDVGEGENLFGARAPGAALGGAGPSGMGGPGPLEGGLSGWVLLKLRKIQEGAGDLDPNRLCWRPGFWHLPRGGSDGEMGSQTVLCGQVVRLCGSD